MQNDLPIIFRKNDRYFYWLCKMKQNHFLVWFIPLRKSWKWCDIDFTIYSFPSWHCRDVHPSMKSCIILNCCFSKSLESQYHLQLVLWEHQPNFEWNFDYFLQLFTTTFILLYFTTFIFLNPFRVDIPLHFTVFQCSTETLEVLSNFFILLLDGLFKNSVEQFACH